MALELSKGGRRYGFLPSPPDHRDYGMTTMPGVIFSARLSPVVSWKEFTGPVKDQGALGACTAFAGCGNREFLARKYFKDEKTKLENPVFSPLDLYYKERREDATLDKGDCGSWGRTAVRVMNKYGVCLENQDPYVPANYETAPNETQIEEASQFRAGAYHALHGVQDMKNCLVSGYAFLMGFEVYESFETKTGSTHVYAPKHGEALLGGHEVFCIGYDDTKQMFEIRNSWGGSWGEGGNFWMPYEIAADTRVVNEAWIQHLGKAW